MQEILVYCKDWGKHVIVDHETVQPFTSTDKDILQESSLANIKRRRS